MAVTSDNIRGQIDTILLRFLKDHDTYGYEINRSIEKLSDGTYRLSEATMYSAFRRLEDEGYIRSYWGDEGTGARRRYYSITEKGIEKYEKNLEDWDLSCRIIERLVR